MSKLVLPKAVEGDVCVRFAPEPSGYLHIGHAKAALLCKYFADKYKGKFILRFDDTNPLLEDVEFEEAIATDLRTILKVEPDQTSHSSDYFEQYESICQELIKRGHFYVDNTDMDTMRKERTEGIESKCRSNSVEDNLSLWEEMKKGTEAGLKCVVRAKISEMTNPNKCMRDPTMYRCIPNTVHHRLGVERSPVVFPMYDFCCPITDSLEKVTHAMRANEYADRVPQYHALQKLMIKEGLLTHAVTAIYEFSRMNMVNTCLSKRKLKWIVDNGIVSDWSDPRFPTIRAIQRRGIKSEALMDFIIQQGTSKKANMMEWDKIYAINKKLLDPVIPRWSCIADGVELLIKVDDDINSSDNNNGIDGTYDRLLHPKADLGTVEAYKSRKVLVERADIDTVTENEKVTLLKFGNVTIEKFIRDDETDKITSAEVVWTPDNDFKGTKKFHWLPVLESRPFVPVILEEYGHIINKVKMDENDEIDAVVNRESKFETDAMADTDIFNHVKLGDTIQFERRGIFILDQYLPGEKPKFILVPDGKTKSMSANITGKIDAKAMNLGTSKQTDKENVK